MLEFGALNSRFHRAPPFCCPASCYQLLQLRDLRFLLLKFLLLFLVQSLDGWEIGVSKDSVAHQVLLVYGVRSL